MLTGLGLRMIMFSFKNYSFLYVALVLLAFVPPHCFAGTGTIILLNGTGSVGKSSIGQELEKTLPNAVFVSEELINHHMFSVMLQKSDQKPCATFKEAIAFLNSVPKESKLGQNFNAWLDGEEAKVVNDNAMISMISEHIEAGKIVIVDFPMSPNFNHEEMEKWKMATAHLQVLHVVVYCPLDKLFEHIKTRNALGDDCEKRGMFDPFDMYKKFYCVQDSGPHIDIIGQVAFEAIKQQVLVVAEQSSDLNQEFFGTLT
jgi:deoxyadenosine/deoxycytidine kinase